MAGSGHYMSTKWSGHRLQRLHKLAMECIGWAHETEWVIKNDFHFLSGATRWMEVDRGTEMGKDGTGVDLTKLSIKNPELGIIVSERLRGKTVKDRHLE